MPTSKTLFRPLAFNAVGEGFVQEETLRDGVHLRLRPDHRFGLPYESPSGHHGGFRIYVLDADVKSVRDADFFQERKSSLPVVSSATPPADRGMTTSGQTLSFWKLTPADLSALFARCHTDLRALRRARRRLSAEDRELLAYAGTVLESLKSDLQTGSLTREHAEACAVDLRVATFTAPGPVPVDTPYLRVRGLDRRGRCVVEDWIGVLAGGATKNIARLRAPGIAKVDLAPVEGAPSTSLGEVRWVLCEDLCQATALWKPFPMFDLRFNADPAYHDPGVTDGVHYKPFLAQIDPYQASALLQDHFVARPDVQKVFQQSDALSMTRVRVDYDAPYPDQGIGTSMRVPVLQNLLAASVDPLVARVLGLYFYSEDFAGLAGFDLKVEASLPFFEQESLSVLEDSLQKLVAIAGGPPRRFFKDPSGTLTGARLCALVLGPSETKKDRPPEPASFETVMTVRATPAQDDAAAEQVVVSSAMSVPVTTQGETRPYLVPIGFSVERSIAMKPFEQVLGGEDPDGLDKIGIVPPLQYPPRQQGAPATSVEIVDALTWSGKSGETLQYRLTAYDLFGRASESVAGEAKPVLVPVDPPSGPTNVSCRAFTEGGKLHLEVNFALSLHLRPLEAARRFAEITVHRLPVSAAGAPADLPGRVTWSGPRLARRIEALALDGRELSVGTVTASCTTLVWSGGVLVRTPAADGACAQEMSTDPPSLIEIDPPAMPRDETGHATYQLRVPLAPVAHLEPDQHRFCARVRVGAEHPDTGEIVFSDEPCVSADHLITPAPADPVRPIPQAIPESTFPDAFGDSYFTIDLASFGLSPGDLVNVYRARVDRVVDSPAALISGGQVLNPGLFEQQARRTKRAYELVTPRPIEYGPATRFHSIKVPGHLRDHHVVGVIGTNSYLQERDWSRAAILVFTTPDPAPLPALRALGARPQAMFGLATLSLSFAVPAASFTDPAHPPKIQLLRRDVTLRATGATFIAEVVGSPAVSPTGEALFRFDFNDATAAPGHRYLYEAYLIVRAGTSGYRRAEQPALQEVVVPWSRESDPFAGTAMRVVDEEPGWQRVSFTFDAGELDFTLVKVREDDSPVRVQGSLRNGALSGVDPEDGSLHITRDGARMLYLLALRIPDDQTGHYQIHLTSGQRTWSRTEGS